MSDHACSLCHIGLEDVSVVRGGQTLLHDVSMHIHCGQLTVLIGQNGAGKTTLIRALLGNCPMAARSATWTEKDAILPICARATCRSICNLTGKCR